MRILAFHAHPDDAEALAGGTLTLLAAQGHEVVIATMTPGDCGSSEYAPEQIAAIRRREATTAAALLGARYICAEFRDLAVFNDEPARRRVTEILRRTRAELVLAAAPEDAQCDHRAAGSLVQDCAFAAATPNYRTGAPNAVPPLPKIPHLYFMDPPGAFDSVVPDFVVDIGPAFPRKQRLLAQHRSQREWLPQFLGIDDPLLRMERWARQRGALAGIEFGEGFRRCLGQGYPQEPLLEELLGGDARPVVAP
ncbi:MAG: PIG-L family deacetylase [Bryobacteraceae bacterium]|jgi:LmbE family N-acetylglucosaminyl deacetylase